VSPLFERIELLPPWQSAGANALCPTKILSVQAFTTREQPYLYSVSQKRQEFWTHVILILSFGLDFDYKETIETHSDLNTSPQQ
jgi:hypothetical protein